jgi:hypothetical protein
MATGFGFISITPMHSARASGAAVALSEGTKVLVAGGGVSEGPFSAELYDDQTGSWTHSEMTTARSRNTATLLKTGQVLVVGGDTSADPSTAEVYTAATNSWVKVFDNLHAPRTAHTATLLPDGRVLVTGGSPAIPGPALNTAEIFDPGTDPVNGSWTVVNPMSVPRAYHTATLLPSGMVLIAGGVADSSNAVALPSAELFDPITAIWTQTSPMNDGHLGHTATLLQPSGVEQSDFVVLIAGGFGTSGDIFTAAELYKPPPPVARQPMAAISAGSWVRARSMNVARMFHTATALPAAGGPLGRDGQVLVTGGPDPGDEVTSGATTEVYDLGTDSWTFTANMRSIRTGHVAVPLGGGRVLLAGGLGGAFGGTTGPVPSAEVGTKCNASAQIVVSPSRTIEFGEVHAGTQDNNPNPETLPTVRNTGNAELTLTATISGPDAALFIANGGLSAFTLTLGGTGPCLSGLPGDGAAGRPGAQFAAWSPVPKTCSATLTLSDSNATNVTPGQTWEFPMTAQIILSPGDVGIEIDGPSFPGTIGVGDTETGQVVIHIMPQAIQSVAAIVRFPPPPARSAFHWSAGDYIVGADGSQAPVSVAIDFTPLAAGSVTQTLQLISNAQGSPHIVTLHGTAKKGLVP